VVKPRARVVDGTGPTATPPPAAPPASLLRRHLVTERKVDGFSCHTVTPRHAASGRACVYLHGGSYVSPIRPPHWNLIAKLADAGMRVEVPHYGLAPQHGYREAYPFVTAVYRRLISDLDPAGVAVAGDSAGGGLALGLAQAFTQEGLAPPGRLVLISPWLDLNLRDPAVPVVEAGDPWLESERLRVNGRSWARGDDPALPRLSPINGPMAQLPTTDIYTGTRDLLHPDALRLAKAATAAGSTVNLTVCEGAVHVYPLLPAPEGRSATRAIIHSLAQP
jgi:acetyl esterase/lipase